MTDSTHKVLMRLSGGDAEETIRVASERKGRVGGFVVGAGLLLDRGPIVVGALRAFGKPVLADLGILDRPRVVARAVARMGRLGARWVSVSGLAGRAAVEAAVREAEEYHRTSVVVSAAQAGFLSGEELKGVGISDTPGTQVSRLTRLASRAGAAGVLFPMRELGVAVQVSAAEQTRVGNPEALSRMAEVPDGLSCFGISDAIGRGAHWVVVTPEQADQLEAGL